MRKNKQLEKPEIVRVMLVDEPTSFRSEEAKKIQDAVGTYEPDPGR